MEGSEEAMSNCYGSYRFKLAMKVMLMSMLGVSYRMSISFSIVCMVNHTAVYDLNVGSATELNTTISLFLETSNDTSDFGVPACEMQNVKDISSLEVFLQNTFFF